MSEKDESKGRFSRLADATQGTLPQASAVLRAAEGGKVDRGQSTNLASLFIGIMIAVIVGVDVALPVILDSISSSNATGNTLTILNLLDLFLALLLLIALASPLMRRV